MKRVIKFRGIAKVDVEDFCKKGDWVYGNLITNNGDPYIVGDIADSDVDYIAHEFWVPVKINTVGQYTGLKDKNGVEIFEGDIIRTLEYNEIWDDGAIGDVIWREAQFRFNWKILLAKSGKKDFRNPISTICSSCAYNSNEREGGIEVVGNIHEHSHLLEGNENGI